MKANKKLTHNDVLTWAKEAKVDLPDQWESIRYNLLDQQKCDFDLNNNRKSLINRTTKKKRLIIACTSIVIPIMIGVICFSWFMNQWIFQSQNPENQYSLTITCSSKIESSESINSPFTTTGFIKFEGFILTAYKANGENSNLNINFMKELDKAVLTSDIKVLLPKYSPITSRVPGFPFTVDISTDDMKIDIINVLADSGALNKWNHVTGVVTSDGQSAKMQSGETIYWSPIDNDISDHSNKITITIEAISNNIIIGKQSIFITQDAIGNYYATVGEVEII